MYIIDSEDAKSAFLDWRFGTGRIPNESESIREVQWLLSRSLTFHDFAMFDALLKRKPKNEMRNVDVPNFFYLSRYYPNTTSVYKSDKTIQCAYCMYMSECPNCGRNGTVRFQQFLTQTNWKVEYIHFIASRKTQLRKNGFLPNMSFEMFQEIENHSKQTCCQK